MTFEKRAAEMGLTKISEEHNDFMYVDKFCKVFYRQVKTSSETLPFFALFCTPNPNSVEEYFGGFVSDLYKFIGNEVVMERAKASILETNVPIIEESYLMNSPKNTKFEYRFSISHGGQRIPSVGDLIPQITVNNSYDGTGIEKLSFGLSFVDQNKSGTHMTFRTKLGSFSQVHTSRAKTRLAGILGSYFEIFSENIGDIVSSSMAKSLSEEEVLKTLDLVEKIGKKKREEISTFLSDLTGSNGSISAWHMFLAIAKFSSLEQNLNVKILMENIAERVLVLPVKMIEALKKA